nr:MAG TPA: hypothetical protein [Caudoviricetes sp.]
MRRLMRARCGVPKRPLNADITCGNPKGMNAGDQHRPPHLIELSVARVAPEKRHRHRLPLIT